MPLRTDEFMKTAENYSDLKLTGTVIRMYEAALKGTHDPALILYCTYNLGVVHLSLAGNGEEAIRYFKDTLFICEYDARVMYMPYSRPFKENACENLMILSLSYEEYIENAEKLRGIKPDADILKGQYPAVMKMRDSGHPWSYAMMVFAQTYYNRNDPRLDSGMYGNALSLYQLILANRRVLRVSKDDMATVMFEYCALMLRHVSDSIKIVEKSRMRIEPNDYLFMMEKACGYYDEYITANQPNEDLKNAFNGLRKFTDDLRAMKEEGPGSRNGSPQRTAREDPIAAKLTKLSNIKCPHCGYQPVDLTKPCPHCGKPIGLKKRAGISCLLTLIIFAGIIFLIVKLIT
jgi:tetratricopeptide (TPR) repeat protein